MESIHQSWQRILDPNLDPRLFRNAFLLAKIKAMSKAIEEEKIEQGYIQYK